MNGSNIIDASHIREPIPPIQVRMIYVQLFLSGFTIPLSTPTTKLTLNTTANIKK
jgi:hypothetical protein